MDLYLYKTSGGKSILKDLSFKAKPIVLTVLEGLKKDGLDNFHTKVINKNVSPTLYEIVKNNIRLFYFLDKDNSINITYITEHKQKNKTEKTDKETALKREKSMIKNPTIHKEKV